MQEHHRQTIARLHDLFEPQENVLALLIGGSLVRGWGLPNSDVDFLLVVTEADYQRRVPDNDLHYVTHELTDYEGGYVDGKIVDVNFLREVADHGNEPTRSAFVDMIVSFSRLPELEGLLQTITAYPEQGRVARMTAFFSEVVMMNWFISEAEKRDDRYLITRSVADMVLFGGRCILAYNRILYPYHKWLMQALREAPEKPPDLLELTAALLDSPSKQTASAYTACLRNFHDWGVSEVGQAAMHFMIDREWHWRRGDAPIHDW